MQRNGGKTLGKMIEGGKIDVDETNEQNSAHISLQIHQKGFRPENRKNGAIS